MRPATDASERAPLSWLVATFFGVGLCPFASGTVATAVAIPLYLAAYFAGGDLAVLALVVLVTVTGVPAAAHMERRLGFHDPSEVVVDEVAGFLLTMLFLPLNLWTCVAGFLLFRALDVLKPWPASRAEKLSGGWGIMADDLVCGLIANGLIHVGVLLWR